ncbi:MAG: GNAT family N-acetyltransferase [Clostridiales bacterium]|nr:GNAT family N-acetyltransferase [Clostridiales bacterium]
MDDILIKPVTKDDIGIWIDLSREYDEYIKELVSDLTHWYEGNETDIAFSDYMTAKIEKNEAFMAIDDKECLGIVAFSKTYNRITFFTVAHNKEYESVGKILMDYAFNQLNTSLDISINVIKSTAEHVRRERAFIEKYGFEFTNEELENGVPVDKMIKKHLKSLI